MVQIQDKWFTSNKAIICCSMFLNKVDLQLRNKYKKIKLGKYTDGKLTLKQFAYLLFNESDRDKVISIFKENKLPNAYFLSLICYNLQSFYPSDTILYHLKILEKTNSMLYKVSNQFLLNYFIYSFQVSTIKKPIRFPPKKDKKPKITVKKTHSEKTSVQSEKTSVKKRAIKKSNTANIKKKKRSVLEY
jgi:hypothetical protein